VQTVFAQLVAQRKRPHQTETILPGEPIRSIQGRLVVDFRFATSCREGYHFWIPVVQYIWYIQYAIFPF
jgi:hypothetical protein